jgi:single-stranded-DNA-specific exonuclease
LDGERGRGSARSVGGVHLRDVLEACSDHVVSFGGHAGAAGCTVTEAAFPALARAFVDETRRALLEAETTPILEVDLELPFRQIRAALVEELELLAPHGAANPPALFVTRGVRVAGNPRVMGRGREHLAFHAREGSSSYRAIAFGMGDRREEIRKAELVDICYRLKFDTYRDPGAVELEIQDLRPVGSA